ncbi:hypothetical protein Tsubulata_026705 [Turnera subulata]|uniref:Thaumatin-like protein n=1 Tax=Turnera subulata TaxID=218843 RepID=A0A9Q0JJH1_9ROSI|nr:hypothetical protein Tsubulata_026705 [Turnera subulata]
MSSSRGEDMYHVSVADGYNLPMIIRPQRGTGNTCVSTGCIQDLNPPCPPELRVVGDDGITTVGLPALPITRAKFQLARLDPSAEDIYEVNMADGYNLPMVIRPKGGTGNVCVSTGCVQDLNSVCPPELKVVGDDGVTTIACKSACLAFGPDEYCCSDEGCVSSSYGQFFKNACMSWGSHPSFRYFGSTRVNKNEGAPRVVVENNPSINNQNIPSSFPTSQGTPTYFSRGGSLVTNAVIWTSLAALAIFSFHLIMFLFLEKHNMISANNISSGDYKYSWERFIVPVRQ